MRIVCRRLYSLSMAASNERIVSSGRSQRDRVGFERSGSAVLLAGIMRFAEGLPMGLPLASVWSNERSDCSVGFSSAAATTGVSDISNWR